LAFFDAQAESTKFGYGRPAALARFFAALFCAGVSFFDVFLGFFVSQNAFFFTTSPYLPNMLHSFCLWQCSLRDGP
jgi:hypothetical protein